MQQIEDMILKKLYVTTATKAMKNIEVHLTNDVKTFMNKICFKNLRVHLEKLNKWRDTPFCYLGHGFDWV